MKALMILIFLFNNSSGFDASIIDSISNALRTGEIEKINQYYAGTVDVTILNEQGFFTKNIAIQKVTSFFKAKEIVGYGIVHEGKSKGKDSVYTIGILSTQKGDFRIYMFITSKGDKHYIEEIKIEPKA